MNKHIKDFLNFDQFIETTFEGSINAHCLKRNLNGNFAEIVQKLTLKDDITELSITDLQQLQLSKEGIIARDVIIKDYKLLQEKGTSPSLNLIKCYASDDDFDVFPTDVYSFHVDSSPISTDTFLCTYFGTCSEIISNEKAIQKILIPEIRKKLYALFDGDEKDFKDFLKDFHFDLHYEVNKSEKPINLGIGNLWKLAVNHPNQKVNPCIHRAPKENINELRLLLIC